MSVILVDLADEKLDLQINMWNRRPTLQIIQDAGLIDGERAKLLSLNFGNKISMAEARSIASFIENRILPQMNENEMMDANGKILSVPDKPRRIDTTPADQLYAARKKWLEKFVAFCKGCGGFKVV